MWELVSVPISSTHTFLCKSWKAACKKVGEKFPQDQHCLSCHRWIYASLMGLLGIDPGKKMDPVRNRTKMHECYCNYSCTPACKWPWRGCCSLNLCTAFFSCQELCWSPRCPEMREHKEDLKPNFAPSSLDCGTISAKFLRKVGIEKKTHSLSYICIRLQWKNVLCVLKKF